MDTPVLAEAIAFALTAIIQAADSGIPQADLDIEQMKILANSLMFSRM